ncbi:MAG: hypothetical protein JJT78_17255 [Leptospira sp.]|nr:hypothetical protein [Leptospira sp.]
MKKLISIIMSYFLLTSCLAFEESLIDPNSPLSALLKLQSLLGRSNTQLQTTIEMEIRRGDNTPYDGNSLRFGKLDGNANQRLISQSKNLPSSTFITNGNVKVALTGLGIFEFRILDIDQNVIAVFQLNIIEGLSDENKDSLVPKIISGDLLITILSIRQEFVQIRDWYLTFFNGMGERSDNIYALALIARQNNTTQSKRLAVLKSSDGLNFNAIYFPGDQFTFESENNAESQQNILFFPTNIIKTGPSTYFFLMQDVASPDPGNPPTYAVEMNETSITNIYSVNKRSSLPEVQSIDMNKIFLLSNELLYAERNTNNGTVEFRLDDNFLNSGSNNTAPSIGNFSQPTGYFNSNYVFEHKNGIIYNRNQATSIATYPINSFSNEYSLTYSGTELSGVINSVFSAGRNSIYYLEQAGVSPGPYTIKLTNIESPSTIFAQNINSNNLFSSTISSPVPFNFFNRVMEFGGIHAIYAFENDQFGLFVSNTSTPSVQYVDLKQKLSIDSFENVSPTNIMEIGNKLTVYRNLTTPGIQPKLVQNESTNGVDWTPNNDVQIQF